MRQNRRPKVYYATQVAANPPTIVLFTNGPELFDNTYQRYLIKTFRDQLGFNDVPIKMYIRKRAQADESGEEGEELSTPVAAKKAPAKRRKPGRKVDGAGVWKDV